MLSLPSAAKDYSIPASAQQLSWLASARQGAYENTLKSKACYSLPVHAQGMVEVAGHLRQCPCLCGQERHILPDQHLWLVCHFWREPATILLHHPLCCCEGWGYGHCWCCHCSCCCRCPRPAAGASAAAACHRSALKLHGLSHVRCCSTVHQAEDERHHTV